MYSIIIPALIGAVSSLIGIFGKEVWIDYKKRKREQKVLAIRLHYILTKYVLDTAIQLQNTKAFIIHKAWTEHGWYSPLGNYNTKLLVLPLNIESLDWNNIETEIISDITKLDLDIRIYSEQLSDIASVLYDDEVEKGYIEKSAILGLDALKIIRLLSSKYDIPYTEIKLNDDTLQDFFT